MLNLTPRWTGRILVVAGCLLLGVTVAASYLGDGIIAILLRPGPSTFERLELVRAYFASWGAVAPFAYVAIVTVEVIVAPIPGLMLYAPGGVIFGGFWGGFLSLVGNVFGAGIACQLMRVVGRKRLERLFAGGRFERYDKQLAQAGVWVILALRINPLTSSDLVSYAAGLTAMPTWKVMVGTLLGMAPLCWAQAYLADELLKAVPWLIFPLLVLCILYAVVAVVIGRKVFSAEAGTR
ncbi:MAG: TVP38/TMEM64 family protein [Verrucomicrobiales bacterium]|nr:TVP38/TMEM64 family protein [Verrucomicrobiales bacterium]